MNTHFINADLVKVYNSTEKKTASLITVLAWGDEVELLESVGSTIKIALQNFKNLQDGSIIPVKSVGFILKSSKTKKEEVLLPLDQKNILKVSFVDVGQGDASVIETPKGKLIFIDGGENQLFARYLASRFPGTSLKNPKVVDCIVVSHGDADHFEGLPQILKSEENKNPKKRLFIKPSIVFHNGLVKRPSSRKEKELLGPTVVQNDQLYLNGLVNRMDEFPEEELNQGFKAWKKTLATYEKQYEYQILQKRLSHKSKGDFNFLADEDISVNVLGPIEETIEGSPALKFMHKPLGPIAEESAETVKNSSGSYSASHTINGHSVILKVQYGNVNFLFAGDLNEEAADFLVANKKSKPIKADIFKVPHHGSADFSNAFLDAVNPFVSVVSSGDENAAKEYIHPRATLVGALGKYSRIDRPLIFVTEMVAFLKTEGWAKLDKPSATQPKGSFFAFSKTAYGIVHVRTDGKRILVFTHSGQKDLKEAYSYTVEKTNDKPKRREVVIV